MAGGEGTPEESRSSKQCNPLITVIDLGPRPPAHTFFWEREKQFLSPPFFLRSCQTAPIGYKM